MGINFPNMASPKYNHNCFCLKYAQLNLQMEEVVVGNWAANRENNDNITPLSPPALQWL